MLGALNAVKDELNSGHSKLENKAKTGKLPDEIPEKVRKAISDLTVGVSVLRTMIVQVSAADIEFAEPLSVFGYLSVSISFTHRFCFLGLLGKLALSKNMNI